MDSGLDALTESEYSSDADVPDERSRRIEAALEFLETGTNDAEHAAAIEHALAEVRPQRLGGG